MSIPDLRFYPTKFNLTLDIDEDKVTSMPPLQVTLSVDSGSGKRLVQIGYVSIYREEGLPKNGVTSYPIEENGFDVVFDVDKNTKKVTGIEFLTTPKAQSTPEIDKFLELCNDPVVTGAFSVGISSWSSVQMVLEMFEEMSNHISQYFKDNPKDLEDDVDETDGDRGA